MELFLIRHAAAEPAGTDQADEARALTVKGRKQFKRVAKGLKQLDVRFDRLYHSPALRAAQTAQLLTRLVKGETIVTSHLADEPSDPLLAELSGERVALVGHEPYLGHLLAWLVTGQREFPLQVAVTKGGVAHLDGEAKPSGMTLKALVPLDMIRAWV